MEAVVLFEYEKQQDDELSLKVGEVILDVKQADEGWCEGVLNGEWGMFPDNFVQLRPVSSGKPPAPAPEAAPAPVPSEHHNANVSSSSALRGHLTPAAKKARRAKVTYSYVAENPDELNLQPGQVVEIVEEEEEGWWKGRVDGKEGLFPSNFVELVEQNGSSDPAHDYSVPPPLDKPPTVDHSMPRDRPEEAFGAAAPPRQSVLGPKLFPAFNPVEARSKLKATTPASKPPAQPLSAADRRMSAGTPKKPAAPPTAVPASKAAKPPAIPPSHPEKPPAKPPEKQVERAKVLFNYTAEQPDELSIKVGEVLEVVSKDVQEGWWEVRQGDQTGLIPDNFVELLPPQSAQPQQPPKPKPPPPSTEKAEPPPQPPTKAAPLPPTGKKPSAKSVPPHPPKSTEPSPPTEDSDFGVPTTTPLDTSALKNRPRNPVSRPPSRSNLQQVQEPEKPSEESPGDSSKLSPWQQEMKARKSKVPIPPSKPAAATKPSPATKPPPAGAKPPSSETESKLKPAPVSSKPPAAKPPPSKPTPPPSTPSETEPVADGAWKEAFDKLKTEFDRFKKEVLREMQILTDDLDKERKNRAELQIDVDRLKKAREFRDNL